MNMKSLKTQFIGAIAMVLVAAIAMGSSTFAWFSLNSKVTVTGMSVKTEVKDNLLIASGAITDTAKPGEDAFKTSYVAMLGDKLLQPTSTVDGKAYFYTDKANVAGSGDHLAASFIAYNTPGTSEMPTTSGDGNELTAFNANAGYNTQAAVGFMDYVFYLKAQNTSSSGADIKVTDLNLVYGADQITDNAALAEKAFRVAFLVKDVTSALPTANKSGDLVTILMSEVDSSGSRYFHQDSTTAQGVASTSGLGNVSNLSTAATLATVAAGKTGYYQVVCRLWLEGEDVTCNNSTFMDLKDQWALDMTIELAGSSSAVTKFDAWDTTTKVDLSTPTAAAWAGTPVVIDNVKYYPITDKTITRDSTSMPLYVMVTSAATSGTVASTDRIFVLIETNTHPIEVTNQCKLPPT